MPSHTSSGCPDCGDWNFSRREFLKTTAVGAAAAVAATAGIIHVGAPRALAAAEAALPATAAGSSETLASMLYQSLSEAQRKLICFPFDHPLRLKVDNNWHIVNSPISDVLSNHQRAMVKDLFLSMHSEEYAGRVYHQVDDDNHEDGKGFDSCAVALFGQPGEKFEF